MNSSDRERDLALANYIKRVSTLQSGIFFGAGKDRYIPYLPVNVREISMDICYDVFEEYRSEGIDFRLSFGFGYKGGRKIYCERDKFLN